MHETLRRQWFGVARRSCRLRRGLPPLLVAASSGDRREAQVARLSCRMLGGFPRFRWRLPEVRGARRGVGARFLQETDVFSSLADNKVLFVVIEIYIYSEVHVRVVFICPGSAPCGETNCIAVQ